MVESVFPIPPVTESPPELGVPPPMTRRSGPPPHPSRRPPPAPPTIPTGPESATESPGLRPKTESGPNEQKVGTHRK
jgi:hypothetical protein